MHRQRWMPEGIPVHQLAVQWPPDVLYVVRTVVMRGAASSFSLTDSIWGPGYAQSVLAIRLVVSMAYWPIIWYIFLVPSALKAMLSTLRQALSELQLFSLRDPKSNSHSSVWWSRPS